MDTVLKSVQCISSSVLSFFGNESEISRSNSTLVFSPINIYSAIVVLAAGADGEYREMLLKLLSITNLDEAYLQNYSKFISEFITDVVNSDACDSTISLKSSYKQRENGKDAAKPNNDMKFRIGMKCLLRDDKRIVKEFEELILKYCKLSPSKYIATGEHCNAVSLKQELDDFIVDVTEGIFRDSMITLSSDTAFALIIASYFYGFWLEPFKERNTFESMFYNNRGEVEFPVQMMVGKHLTVGVGIEPSSKFLRYDLPFLYDYIFSVIMVEDGESKNNIQMIVEEFKKNPDFLSMFAVEEAEIDEFRMPKYDIESMIDLMQIIENSCSSNKHATPIVSLANMTDGPYSLKFKHACALKVNEAGCESAAVSYFDVCDGVFDVKKVVVNKPFVAIIWHEGYSSVPLIVATVGSIIDSER